MTSFRVSGRLVHADQRQDALHHVYVELHDGDVFRDDFLGSTYTTGDGSFDITYDPAASGGLDRPDLRLRIFRQEHSFDRRSGDVVLAKVLVAEIEGPQNPSFETFHFGTLRVDWFEYDDSLGLPRCKALPNGELPQKYAPGYWPALIWKDGPIKLRHLEVKTAINVGSGVDPM